MPDYLLDCNHLSAALRKVSPVRERMVTARGTATASPALALASCT